MKKRSFGVLLILVLTLMLLTTAVLAAEIELNEAYVQKNHNWDVNGVILYGGNTYTLENDLTLDGKFLKIDASNKGGSYSCNVTLDLKGKTLTIKDPASITGHTEFGVFYYSDRQGKQARETSPIGILVYDRPDEEAAPITLTLKDSSEAKTGKLIIEGQDAEKAIGIYVGRNCTLNIEGGTITNSTTVRANTYTATGVQAVLGTVSMTGGRIENQSIGVWLEGGAFHMSDNAEIANCGYLDADGKPKGASGVNARVGFKESSDNTGIQGTNQHPSTLTMSGGTIRDCMAEGGGGGVSLHDGSTFTMSGEAKITGCKTAGKGITYSNSGGGGVYVGGTFEMSGGTISNCEAVSRSGGGVYVAGTFNMSGGTIKDCKAAASGGGGVAVYRDDSGLTTFTMTGGTIKDCTSAAGGGGAFIFQSGFTMSGSASITDCKAEVEKHGDCIFIDRSSAAFRVDDRDITINGRITQYFGNNLIDGLGTEKFPYQIGSKAELELFRDIVNGTAGNFIPAQRDACAELTADINLENANWTPIGPNDGNSYTGTFDGKGHTIKGLNVTTAYSGGLFCWIDSGTVQNLSVAGTVTGTGEHSRIGGIASTVIDGRITNCANLCTVTQTGNSSGGTGGIVGYLALQNGYKQSEMLLISDCYNLGTVTGYDIGGGIAGYISCPYEVELISNCYNTGKVTGTRAGEITGSGSGYFENCYYLSDTDTDPAARTAEEFADGTVLNLLINNRGDSEHPWADECQYVDAAGKVLPVFKNQDTHKHTDPLEHVEAKEPTTGADGNIEYWYCPVCGKYFSDKDAKHEITQAETVRERLPHTGSRFTYSSITAEAGKNGSVSPSGETSVRDGKSQTFVFTPDKGYRVKDVLIDGRSVGALRSYTFATVRRDHTVEVTFERIPAFTDVPAGAYYADAVDWAVENWITEGTSDTRFSPDSPCTRAQAVTFLWRAAGCPAPSSYAMPFEDVKSGSYYETAVLWALENGITKGVSETRFEPESVCTRAQIVSFLYRMVQAEGGGFTGAWMFRLPFTDTPEWAYEAIAWCYQNGITEGTGEAAFSPDSPCTRAQIVTFLWRCRK